MREEHVAPKKRVCVYARATAYLSLPDAACCLWRLRTHRALLHPHPRVASLSRLSVVRIWDKKLQRAWYAQLRASRAIREGERQKDPKRRERKSLPGFPPIDSTDIIIRVFTRLTVSAIAYLGNHEEAKQMNFNAISRAGGNFMNIKSFNYCKLKWYLRRRATPFFSPPSCTSCFLFDSLSFGFSFIRSAHGGDFKRDAQFQPRAPTNAASRSLCIWLSIPRLHQWFRYVRKPPGGVCLLEYCTCLC